MPLWYVIMLECPGKQRRGGQGEGGHGKCREATIYINHDNVWGNTSPINIQHLPLNFFCLRYSLHQNITTWLSILRILQCSLSCCITGSWCSWLLTDDMNNKKGRVNKSGCRWGKMRWGSWSAEYIMTKHFDRQTQNKVPKSLSPDSFVKWVRTLLILYVCAREHFATVCLVVLCICICVEGLEAMPFFFCKFDNLYILLWLWVVLAPLVNGIVSWCGSGIWKGNVRRVCWNNMSKGELTHSRIQELGAVELVKHRHQNRYWCRWFHAP